MRLVQGNPGKRDMPVGASLEDIELREEPLEPPKKLTKAQAKVWQSDIEPHPWILQSDSMMAYAYVCLACEFMRSPANMIPSRISQLRTLASSLGLDPSSRTRIPGAEVKPGAGAGGDDKNPERFFG